MRELFKLRGEIERKQYTGLVILSFILIFLVWYLVTKIQLIETMLLPTPDTVIQNIMAGLQGSTLGEDISISVYRIVMGFLLAVVLGVPIGILVGSFKGIEAFIRPICEFIRYMPVPAFVPMVMVWAGIGEMAKILIVFLGTFFQLVLMVADDVMAVPEDLLNSSYTLGANKRTVIQKVLLPAMAPRLMETLRMTIGWAWTYLIVAELVASDSGLGYMIMKAQRFFQSDAIFAGILIIGIIGLITDRLFALVIKLMFPWEERKR